MSVQSQILNLNTKKIYITTISEFMPKRWKGNVVSEKSKLVWKKMINKVSKSTIHSALVVKLVDTKDLKSFKDKIYYLR